jgi:hypothetical protein
MSYAKLARLLGVLVLAGGVGVLFGWLKSRESDAHAIALPPVPSEASVAMAPAAVAPEKPMSPPKYERPVHVSQPKPRTPTITQANGDWEQQLEDVLLTDTNLNTKADRILALIPTAPPDAQVELSQHLVNLVQDDHYEGAAGLLTNASTPAAVSTVLMNDLLNRNNTLKLPMLLAVARDDQHPLKDQARDMLELLVQADNGTNWDQWSASINTWLQNNSQ